ncbi:MAG: amidohydrolase family protein [Deltaproteobacteria bacterium]|nr:amidohydrolase family protein [Deltaproteobacteria bacterium]
MLKKQDEGKLSADETKAIKLSTNILEDKYLTLRKFIEAGIKCMAGNDAGIAIVGYGTFSGELDTMVEAGMTPAQAIASATKIPAEAMGLFDEVGSLEVGKQADIIAVKDDPTLNILALEKVSFVMKAGEIHLKEDSVASA